jgi:signal transduction histidine kinase/CheY-like chemotaxis protein
MEVSCKIVYNSAEIEWRLIAMLLGNILYIVYSCISIAIPTVMAYLFWKRRSSIGALSMSVLMICELQWSLSSFLSAISLNMQTKLFLNSLSFIAAAIMPVIWFIFSVQYTHQEKRSMKKYYCFLSIIPAITMAILFTNNIHHLFIAETIIELLPNSTLMLVSYKFGILFWIHAIYSYSLLMLGAFTLLIRLIGSIKIYRNQASLMIGALIISFSGEIIYQLGLGPFNNLLLTPFTFSLGAILLFVSMFRYKALDLVPIAREAIIETMGDLVIVLDIKNRIIDVNSSARRVFHKEYKTIIGQPIGSLLKNVPVLTDKATPNDKAHCEIMLEIENKKTYYNVQLLPLYNKQKTIIGSFIILMDITYLYETMKKLEKAKSLAESANQAKSDFLATMSHEIRTPINGIIGMAELLETAKLTSQERDNLEALQYSADSLLHLINDILDFSKIEAGKMEIENIAFDIREIVNSTAKTYHSNNKSVSLSLEIDRAVPNTLFGDYVKLRQILLNLISNAFKFTVVGEIHIRVYPIHAAEDDIVLGFCISDTGIGISESKIESLFQSFHQLDNSTTRKYGGAGLGLSIVKKLIDLLDGSIRVESVENKGSKFYFQLPFKVLQNSSASAYSIEASTASDPLKILVAEDSRVNQMLISQLLQKKNWTADIAENGKDAVNMLQGNHYDLILMDIQMPEMNGYEAVKVIREMEKSSDSHIPIIALTANATQEDKAKCLQCGMEDFLSKPIKSDKLYECILKHTAK